MPYVDTSALQRQVEALRTPRPRGSYASGLADGIRRYRARGLDKELQEKQDKNEALKTQEMQRLMDALTGTSIPMQPGRMPRFSHPEVQQLALAAQLKKAQQDPAKPMSVAPGNVLYDPNTNRPIFRNPKEPSDPSLQPFQAILPDGTSTLVNYNPKSGSYTSEGGQPFNMTPDMRLARIGQPQGAMGDVVPQSTRGEMQDMQIATQNFIDTGNDVLRTLQETPSAQTPIGDAAAITNSIKATLGAAADELGFELKTDFLDPANVDEGTWRDLGVTTNELKSAATALAYARAFANNPDGRISERDFQAALREIGGNVNDPASFANTLRSVMERTVRSFETAHRIKMGDDFEGQFDIYEPEVTKEQLLEEGLTEEQAQEYLRLKYGR